MAFGKRYYLKIDPALPSPAVWVSDIKDATPFRIEREAQAINNIGRTAVDIVEDTTLNCCCVLTKVWTSENFPSD